MADMGGESEEMRDPTSSKSSPPNLSSAMTRILFLLVAFAALAVSFGCQMCGSQYDYCVPAYSDHEGDYRGCDPMYRAGSIFNGNGEDSSYFNDPDCKDCKSDGNVGLFGKTTNIDKAKAPRKSLTTKGPGLGIPESQPLPDGSRQTGPEIDDSIPIPTMEDLLKGIPSSEPMVPSPQPTQPPSTRPDAIESSPFVPQTVEPKITVEELRRLDPTVTDVKILNIDDSEFR